MAEPALPSEGLGAPLPPLNDPQPGWWLDMTPAQRTAFEAMCQWWALNMTPTGAFIVGSLAGGIGTDIFGTMLRELFIAAAVSIDKASLLHTYAPHTAPLEQTTFTQLGHPEREAWYRAMPMITDRTPDRRPTGTTAEQALLAEIFDTHDELYTVLDGNGNTIRENPVTKVPDLMEALEKSVTDAKAERQAQNDPPGAHDA